MADQQRELIGQKELDPTTRPVTELAWLDKLAIRLARSSEVGHRGGQSHPFLTSSKQFEAVLQKGAQAFRSVPIEDIQLAYTAEWMLDNTYILLENLRQIGTDMPAGFYRLLPVETKEGDNGYPRIYNIAKEVVSTLNNHVEIEQIKRFFQVFQVSTPLEMGEIWAIPTMIRIAILENLFLSVDKIIDLQSPLINQLPANNSQVTGILGTVVISNGIISLRTLNREDWKDFFEELSLVDQALRGDPAKVYAKMDFTTRNRYREAVEELSRGTKVSETEVARQALALAQAEMKARGKSSTGWDNSQGRIPPRNTHVGYYLISGGRRQLEERLGYKPSGAASIRRWMFAHPSLVYLGSISLTTLVVSILLGSYAFSTGASWIAAFLIGLLFFFPVIILIEGMADWVITHIVPPRILPKLDFTKGIPASFSTMVAVPVMLSSPDEVRDLLQQLELHHLRNPSNHLYFALLADLPDAKEAVMPGDQALIDQVFDGIRKLNERYPRKPARPFYVFIRERLWNPSEKVWMGWERKRGKLHELNRLLRGGKPTSYNVIEGDLTTLKNIQFVITLDADTTLPRETAYQLVGCLAHPLNRAKFEHQTNRVTSGYTILQPRVEISPSSASQTIFSKIYSGDPGLDLYSRAVSDVYQDLFSEGIYIGKGIYAVEAFERSLATRIPENALLSHDLFEGLWGRVGLVSDLTLIEDLPAHYLVHVRRMHRWIRGDWQLLPWLFPRVPTASLEKVPSSFPLISRWKLFDNLLRSLIPPIVLGLLLLGWTVFPGSPWLWTLASILIPGAPVLTAIAGFVGGISGGASLRQSFRPVKDSAARWLLGLVFLPYEASLNLDAIVTSLYRVYVSHRHMLEWTTAAHTQRLFGEEVTHRTAWREMGLGILWAVAIGLLVALAKPTNLWAAAPLLAAWLLSPQIAFWTSQPALKPEPALDKTERAKLRRLARRTWLYFDQFVGPEDHWLPPDHFQEYPVGVVAHRTSPTNIGVYLLSALSAYDLGYISLIDLVARLDATFDEMGELSRYRGHFLNWYDTRTLSPLLPEYISTVDSGNLAASLLALRQGCQPLDHNPVLRLQNWEGLLDTVSLVDDVLNRMKSDRADLDTTALHTQISDIRREIVSVRHKPEEWMALLQHLKNDTWQTFADTMLSFVEKEAQHISHEHLRQLRIYIKQFHKDLENILRAANILLPWLRFLHQPPRYCTSEDSPVEIRVAWQALLANLPPSPELRGVEAVCINAQAQLSRLLSLLEVQDSALEEVRVAQSWSNQLSEALDSARLNAKALMIGVQGLIRTAENYFWDMDFSFLYDTRLKIFRIGYNATSGKPDNNYYDLLASEARIASLVAIAKGDVHQGHWLHLNRPVTQVDGKLALLSWSATMFEYLMPELIMRSYPGTMIDQTVKAVVERQIEYGKEKNIPWGISESGYYAFDINQNYQYRAFGVPGLGFKRGLSTDLVITPYASLLALPVQPNAVMKNIDHLRQYQMVGMYGLYEAIDYTTSRIGLGRKYARVQSYMSHHQGMILLSLVNYLAGNVMIERFHADPLIRSVEQLLQEQVPETPPLQYPHTNDGQVSPLLKPHVNVAPWVVDLGTNLPIVHLLSNGRYMVMLTNAGTGYTRWNEIDVTRWRPDTTLDPYGTFIFLQDMDTGYAWTACVQNGDNSTEIGEVLFSPYKAEYHRREADISTVSEVVVHPDDDVEIRRITITNHSSQTRRLRILSYGELTLSPAGSDLHHPAFNKLFIESEYLADYNTLLFRRRPRSESEERIFSGHMLVCGPTLTRNGKYESDREKFLGRGHSIKEPQVLRWGTPLSGTTGATLDPIFSISQWVDLDPHETVQVAFLTMVTSTRSELVSLAARYQPWQSINLTFDQARTRTEVQYRQTGLESSHQAVIERLLSPLIYPHPALRAPTQTLRSNRRGQSGLWAFGISGDYPILLVELNDPQEISIIQETLNAHLFWRDRQIKIDLVIINQQGTDYGQELHSQLYRLISRMHSETWINRRGGIYLLHADQIDEDSRNLLYSAASVILYGNRGALEDQIKVLDRRVSDLPAFSSMISQPVQQQTTPPLPYPEGLQFENGMGGFSPDGSEYIIYLEPGNWTPAPWINVIANEQFGFTISESGGGTTWAVNSGENRLTPWRNDPVSDPPTEVIYLRDEETGEVWTPTPLPAGDGEPYLIRHGMGRTTFEHHSQGLKQQIQLNVAPDDPVKIVRLRLENCWDSPRRITATYYVEWVLGTTRENSGTYLIPEFEAESQAVLIRNPYHPSLNERVAFTTANKKLHSLTTDRTEFIGRLGEMREPAALQRIGLSGKVEPGTDTCTALQVHIDLEPNQVEEVYFLLGQGTDREHAIELIRRYQNPEQADSAARDSVQFWRELLGTVHVRTPDPAMDLLLNRWLLYQALACRIWGRTAHYQSSGAFGFRDQLQDVMAVIFSRPDLAREHILRAARHQFEAGDVLHWWHPPMTRGVRTRSSDDLLWLPFVTAHYVQTTGDWSILHEAVPFLIGPDLKPTEDEHYGQFETTEKLFSLYEHCLRAINKGSTKGPHGLPLIGSSDWNDGMNRVGIEGRGESIWLGWFLHSTLTQFIDICRELGDTHLEEAFRDRAEELRQALEESGWDENWYLRAYYDDGTPLGSADNPEAQIDSIAQSWAVLSGAGDPERSKLAMRSVLERLVRWDDRLILLFTPPFDHTAHDPGYIKGYLPGIRENGGQYTHAALWTIWAFAKMGEGDLAVDLFRLINPILHTDSPEKVQKYQVEPYVIAADVYSVPPHTGRGGWTWYTGSSGWMYRLGLEAILGLKRSGNEILIDPCIPKDWRSYEIIYRDGDTFYRIQVENPLGVNRGVETITLDGEPLPHNRILMIKDDQDHIVHVVLG